MSRIALVTSSFEGIDRIKPIARHPDVETICFTDQATLADSDGAGTWSRVVIPDYPLAELPSRMRARYFKTQIHRLKEVGSRRWLVWTDALFSFHDLEFLTELTATLDALDHRSRLFLMPHPDRKTVAEEFAFIRRAMETGSEYLHLRYDLQLMTQQMDMFIAKGMNVNGRLWASGFWVVENNVHINACWDAWWKQTLQFGVMDQLPLPPLLDAYGLKPQTLPINFRDNEYFKWTGHQDPVWGISSALPGGRPCAALHPIDMDH